MRRGLSLYRALMTTLAFYLLVASMTDTGQAQESVTKPVKIGVIYNLSGAQASLDQPSARGVQLAVTRINAAGGVLGRQLELAVYDGKTDLAEIHTRMEALVTASGAVAVVGLSDTNMVLAAAPVAAEAAKVFLTSGATSPKLPEQVPEYLFLACFGDNAQAAAGAEYAYETLKARTVSLLFDTDIDYTKLLSHYFKTRFVELGGEVILEDSYRRQPLNLSPHLDKLKALARQPDLLYVAAGPDEVGTIVKQLREGGITAPIMGGDSYDTPLLLSTSGEAANNVYYTTHVLLNEATGNARVKEFIAAYKARFGMLPESAFAGLGYDSILLLVDAITRAGSDDPQAIRQALQTTTNVQGVTGTISFDHNSRIPKKTVTLVQITNRKATLTAEILPQHVPPP
jgi:branched-chain amino acid transport system substrate-binding protein